MTSTKVNKKKIYFDFYQCEVISSQNLAIQNIDMNIVFQNLLDTFLNKSSKTDKRISGQLFDLSKIEKLEYGFRGIICKYRIANLPHVATIRGEERELDLKENEHLIEKTFFKYFSDCSLLVMQRNKNSISYNKLSTYLTSNNNTVSLNPIIEEADLKVLMSNHSNLRWAKIKIARPTNPTLFEDTGHDFDNSIIQSLNTLNTGASINIILSGDGRSKDPETRYLDPAYKRIFFELANRFDVKKSQLELEEDGISHPIDLIADRLVYCETLEFNGLYPNNEDIWSALMNAKTEKQNELNNYFGILGNRLE